MPLVGTLYSSMPLVGTLYPMVNSHFSLYSKMYFVKKHIFSSSPKYLKFAPNSKFLKVWNLYLFSCGSRLRSCETVPTVAAVRGFCRVRGVPKVQPAEDTQTMTHARSTISLVVRVISRSKNNFYDVIRLKIIESRYFPKETVKVGLEKIKQNGGQLKATKCRWISSAEISNLDVDRDFSR